MRKVLNSLDRNARDLRLGLKMQSNTTESFPARCEVSGHRL